MQILSAGIIEQALLGVEFGQTQHRFRGDLQLAQLLVHSDGFNGETLRRISLANIFETLDSLLLLTAAGVEIANGVQYGKVFGIGFQNLFVFGDGVL